MKTWKVKITDWFRNQSIRKRILLSFMMMSTITALGVSTGSILMEYLNGRRQMSERLESVILLKRMGIENWVVSLQNELLVILNDSYNTEQIPVVLEVARSNHFFPWYNEAVLRRLRTFQTQSTQFEAFCLLDLNGVVVLCTDFDWLGERCTEAQFFQEGIVRTYSEFPFISEEMILLEDCSILAHAKDNQYTLVSRPVFDIRGKVVGVIVGLARPDSLASILRDKTGLGEHGKAYISNIENGLLLANSTSETRSLNPVSAEEVGAFTSRLEDVRDSKFFSSGMYQDYLGNQVMGVMYWLPNVRLVLSVEQDIVDVFRSIALNLLLSFGIGLGAVFATAIIAVFITRSITKPVTILANTAAEIASGNLERVVPVQGNDEISSLGRTFNTMTVQLRDLINNLEQKVQHRTLDLQQANQSLQQHALKLEASAEVSQKIISFLDFDDLLKQVTMLLAETFQYEDVRIYLLEEDNLVLRASSRGFLPPDSSIPMDTECIYTKAIIDHRPVVSSNCIIAQDRLIKNGDQCTPKEMCVPIEAGKNSLGILNIAARQLENFTSEDIILLQSLADQVAVAIENSRLHKRSLELAVLEERSRLARDLHDSVVQYLYSLNLMISGWKRLIRFGETLNLEANLERISQISHQALKEMRLMVYQLQPSEGEWKGLAANLSHRLEFVEERTGVKTKLVMPQKFVLPLKIEECLYLIAQEALNNALKHASASEVEIYLELNDKGICLRVTDNGIGFEPSNEVFRSGMGLTNMQARAEEWHGIFTVWSEKGKGTEISVIIPFAGI